MVTLEKFKMIHGVKLRQIGPHLAIASGSIFGSYLLAIYLDSKNKTKVRILNQYINLSQRETFKYSESNGLIENIQNFWKQSRESQKTIYSLIAANSTIFLAWRIPAFSVYLNRYFLHSINSHPSSMLGSIFSHKSFVHLGFNMMALYSFGTFLHEKMGREQFLAFYISSGMSSSLTSHMYKSFRRNNTPSLGASGAIFGVVGGCAHFPELKVSLIFLPVHSVPISQALPAMMGIDALGLLLDWKIFDHAAHLGGSLFGYSLYPISQNKIWKNRKEIQRYMGF
jgi:rhomboid-like protein